MSTHTTIDEMQIDSLRLASRGAVMIPPDLDYESARRVWNGSIDGHPAVVVRPTGTADVIAAVRFAGQNSLPVAVRGGGHSFAGFGTCDGGLLVDLGEMKGVRVDPRAHRVTAQGGVTWAELDHETGAFGLATTGGLVSSTGIAGLTLGGGIGWLMRKHGLACDNLVGADVVTADGRLVHVSDQEHGALFWALRGGGGNFGVVTSFEYRLHPVSTVLGGILLYPAEYAVELFTRYAECSKTEPDELSTLLVLEAAPEADFIPPEYRGRPAVILGVCYTGPTADGEAAIAPWRQAAPLIADLVGCMPYPALQSLFDEDFPPGLWSYMKTHYLDDLSSEAVELIVKTAAACPNRRSFIDLRHLGGAPARMDNNATAFDNRNAQYAVMFAGISESSDEFGECRTWARDGWETLSSQATGQSYGNFDTDHDQASVRAAWGTEKYNRLVDVKNLYDPDNQFRFNRNIVPSGNGR